MKLLLDTHIALWAVSDDPRLSDRGRAILENRTNSVSVSAATLWEIAIKRSIRPAEMPITAAEAREYFHRSGYLTLHIEGAHVLRVADLPQIHRDPFDRILVAQALEDGFHLLTHDEILARYSELVVVV